MEELDELVTKKAGFNSVFTISSQTYSRKIDLDILNSLGSFGATVSNYSRLDTVLNSVSYHNY